MKYFQSALLLVLFFVPLFSTHAQTPCGNIIAPVDPNNPMVDIVTTPVTNCDDPFNKTVGTLSPYTLHVHDTVIHEGDTVDVPEGGINNFYVEGHPLLSGANHLFFLHDGNDYRYIDTRPLPPTEADYRTLASAFFAPGTDIEPYIQAAVSGDYTTLSDGAQTTYFNFIDYVDANFPVIPAPLRAGTYTLVSKEFQFILSKETFLQKLFAFVVSTAHAQDYPENIFTLTFTITEMPPTPTGASSVLFLPGIMGSRLYEESDVCGSGIFEKERWVSSSNCDQQRLMTNVAGQSINSIYTRKGDGSIVDETYSFNLYKTFLAKLNDWKNSGVIADYATVPYDWRLRLDDLLKARLDSSSGKVAYDVGGTVEEGYLYQTLSQLAQNSATGKVTIVAHSNGGLLAKALLASLQSKHDPLAEKIDNLILVAVPQVGTPDSVVGMLHGTEIGPGGAIISQEMTRQLMSTMPFAYHLLPTQSYFSSAGVTTATPVLTFESGELTTPWANTFGSTVTSEAKLHDFLRKENGRTVPSSSDLLTPAVVDGFLFNYSTTIEQVLNNWAPLPSTHVYEIAGVGLDTPTGITYFTDRECASRSITRLFMCSSYRNKLGYRVNFTVDGDATVVAPSALAMSSEAGKVDRKWLDLARYNNAGIGGSTNLNRRHKDIFEVVDIANFIQNTLQATTSQPYQYLSSTSPELPNGDRLVFYLHSPLDMSITAQNGEKISSTTSTIAGATYRRYGELQYISLPNTTANKTLVLNGQKEGSFTLEIEEYKGGSFTKRNVYSGIPSGTSTIVKMELQNSVPVASSTVVVDYDGNGAPDVTYNTQGVVAEVGTYATLNSALNALSLKPVYKIILVETAKVAQQYYEKSLTQSKYKKLEVTTLLILKQQIIVYEKLHLISANESQKLISIIDTLINK